MQSKILKSALFFLLVFSMSGCEAIAGIFKAGMGFGIFIVIIVIAVIALIIAKLGGNK